MAALELPWIDFVKRGVTGCSSHLLCQRFLSEHLMFRKNGGGIGHGTAHSFP